MILEFKTYKIHYEVHGQGKPLIILNGIMMSTSSWRQFLEDLSSYQVILLDFIDQGQSSSGVDYGHHLQVDVVHAVITELGLAEINIIGISYGAQIALQYALKYSVNQLMLCNGALYTTPWLKDIGEAWKMVAVKKDPELFFHVTIPYIYSHHFYNKEYQWIAKRKETLLKILDEHFMNRMIRLIETSETYDVREKAHAITCQTHVLASEFDYLTPADETYDIYQTIPNASYEVFLGCGHASMYENPNGFVEVIKQHFV
jgi:pimeloyl-ACP methyl ester carboxylesterase